MENIVIYKRGKFFRREFYFYCKPCGCEWSAKRPDWILGDSYRQNSGKRYYVVLSTCPDCGRLATRDIEIYG